MVITVDADPSSPQERLQGNILTNFKRLNNTIRIKYFSKLSHFCDNVDPDKNTDLINYYKLSFYYVYPVI